MLAYRFNFAIARTKDFKYFFSTEVEKLHIPLLPHHNMNSFLKLLSNSKSKDFSSFCVREKIQSQPSLSSAKVNNFPQLVKLMGNSKFQNH